MRSLMFCDFVDPKNAARPYTEVQNMEKLQLVMENYLEEYNNISKKPMNLVLFRYMNNQRTTSPLKNSLDVMKVAHSTRRVSANTKPHKLCWGDREMGTA